MLSIVKTLVSVFLFAFQISSLPFPALYPGGAIPPTICPSTTKPGTAL